MDIKKIAENIYGCIYKERIYIGESVYNNSFVDYSLEKIKYNKTKDGRLEIIKNIIMNHDIKKLPVDPKEIEIHKRKETVYEALGTLLLIGVLVIVLSALVMAIGFI